MIPARYVMAMEDERFEVLPEGLYRHSFLREYADFLGLDGGLYVDEYVSRFEPEEPEAPPPRRSVAVSAPSALKVAALVGGAALLGLAVWGLGGSESKQRGLPTKAAHTARPFKPPAKSAPAVKAPSHPVSLVLVASRGRCWLSVHIGSRNGTAVYQGTLEVGQSARFGLRRPLWVRLGAPQYVDATIRGRPLANWPQDVANIVITGKGIQTA